MATIRQSQAAFRKGRGVFVALVFLAEVCGHQIKLCRKAADIIKGLNYYIFCRTRWICPDYYGIMCSVETTVVSAQKKGSTRWQMT